MSLKMQLFIAVFSLLESKCKFDGDVLFSYGVERFQVCGKGCLQDKDYVDDGLLVCIECGKEDNESYCESQSTCKWENGKCKSTSCPDIAEKYMHDDDMLELRFRDDNATYMTEHSADDRKIALRAVCHKAYSCIAKVTYSRCSYFSIWAFVLMLVLIIVVVGGSVIVAALCYCDIITLSCCTSCGEDCCSCFSDACCETDSDTGIEVLCCSMCPRVGFCIGVIALFGLFLPFIIYFSIAAYGFLDAGPRPATADTDSDTNSEKERPILFYFMMDYPSDVVLSSVVVSLLVVLDVGLTVTIIFFRIHHAKNNPLDYLPAFGLTLLLILPVVAVDVLEIVTLFVNAGSFVLLVWPFTNFLRVVDLVVVLVFRTKKICGRCHKGGYGWPFVLMDMAGTAAGFLAAEDMLWEKIVSLVTESFDTVFAILYVVNYHVTPHLPDGLLHVFSFLKITVVAVNVAMAVKNYIWVKNYGLSVGIGIGLGVFVFLPLVVLLGLSLAGSKSKRVVVFCMIPLYVVAFGLSVLVLVRGGTGVDAEDLVFYQAEGTEAVDEEDL